MGGTICRIEEPEAEEKNKRMGYIKKPTEPLQVISSGKGIANICSQQIGHPQQNYFQFEEFSFNSKFESGNLALVQRVGLYNYNIWVNPEQKSPNHHGTNAWFYFEVRPLSVGPSEVQEGKFTIKNLPNDLDEAFDRGAGPVYLNINQSPEWQYVNNANLETLVYENLIELKIKHVFTGKDDKVAFAFSFPYTLKDAENFLDSIETLSSENPRVHFVRQVIAESLEKKLIECITFTGCKGSEGSHFKPNKSYKSFSEQNSITEDCDTDEECYKGKKCVLITCRTCPGETAASFALEGFFRRILCENDEISKLVLSNFVFLIIPVVNPDGVIRGNMRTDSRGRDLSRSFDRATKDNYPGPQRIREIAKKLKNDGILTMTLDLRANYLFDSVTLNSSIHRNPEKDIPISIFSLLFDMYCKKEVTIKRSDLKELQMKDSLLSNFSPIIENSEQKLKTNSTPLDFNYGLKAFAMSNADFPLKNKETKTQKIRKEGCRVYMDQTLDVTLAFCIDINFFWGVKRDNPYINNDASVLNTWDDMIESTKSPTNRNIRSQTQPSCIESSKRIEGADPLITKNIKKHRELVKMYPNDYREIGESFLLSLLELEGINSKSILPKTCFKTSVELYEYCKNELSHSSPTKDESNDRYNKIAVPRSLS